MAFIIQHNINTLKASRRIAAMPTGDKTRRGIKCKRTFEALGEAREFANGPLLLKLRKYQQEEIRIVILDADTLEQVDRVTIAFKPVIGSF